MFCYIYRLDVVFLHVMRRRGKGRHCYRRVFYLAIIRGVLRRMISDMAPNSFRK